MIDALLDPGNIVFTGSLAVMLLIAAVEGVGALIGASVSEHLQSLLPDTDAGAEIDVSEAALGPFTRALGWLQVGKVPLLMLLVAFLTIFGLGGIVLQTVVKGIFGSYLPPWIAVPAVSVGSLLLLRAASAVLTRVIPMEETDAVTEESFVGMVATITLGTARHGEPAQAKLRDAHGHTHLRHGGTGRPGGRVRRVGGGADHPPHERPIRGRRLRKRSTQGRHPSTLKERNP